MANARHSAQQYSGNGAGSLRSDDPRAEFAKGQFSGLLPLPAPAALAEQQFSGSMNGSLPMLWRAELSEQQFSATAATPSSPDLSIDQPWNQGYLTVQLKNGMVVESWFEADLPALLQRLSIAADQQAAGRDNSI